MYCKKCGKKLEDDACFCRFCGEKIQSAEEALQTDHVQAKNTSSRSAGKYQKKKKRSKWIIIGLGLVAIFTIAILLGRGTNKPDSIPPVPDLNEITVTADTTEAEGSIKMSSEAELVTEEIEHSETLPAETEEPFSNVVLLNQDDIYAEFRGISEYSSESWIVNLYVENNRDSEIYLSLRDGLINKFSTGFSNNGVTIPANSKYLAAPNFDLIIDLDDLAEYGVSCIETLDFNLHISTSMFGDKICEVPVNLEVNKMITSAVSKPMENLQQETLLDENDIYAEFRGISEYSSESWIVNLYVENNRDSEIYLSLHDGQINKFSVGFSNNGATIPANSKYLSSPNFDLIIDLDDLAEYGITTLETLNFNLSFSTAMFGEKICEVPVSLDINKPLE